jgi:amidase
VLDRSPCGSSSGSGAAVAANLCAVAIGTETDGSVICPASNCGIVGFKPTVGLWSRSGIIPISKTQDTAGPMARTVKDAAILLGLLTGADSKDAATQSGDRKVAADYAANLSATSLQGKRIGVEKAFLEGHEGVVALYKDAIEVLKKLGATVVEVELLKQTGSFSDHEFTLLKYEFKDGLNQYLAYSGAKIKSLEEIIQFNKANEPEAMPFFKQELLEQSQALGGLDSPEYLNALKNTLGSRAIIDAVMRDNKLDAICGTSIGPACCIDLVNGDSISGFYFCSPAAMAGYPHITVPMGTVHELPMGFSFVSRAWDELNLLGYAYAFEQATQKREKPRFLHSLNPA